MKNKKPYLVAEISANHCGNFALAKKLIKCAKINGADAVKLGFKNLKFDVLIYGFCLYLVDAEDLFKVVYEADKILKKNSHIIIYDFYSKNSKYLNYRHDKRVKVHKYNFSKIFLWHPKKKLI